MAESITKRANNKLYSLLFILLLIRPYSSGLLNHMGIRIVDLSISAALLVIVFYFARIKLNRYLKILLLLIGLQVVLYSTGTLLNLQYNSLSSIPDLFRYVLVVPFAFFGYAWSKDGFHLSDLEKTIFLLIILNVLYASFQWILKGTAIDILFSGEFTGLENRRRAFSFYGNPNRFAFVQNLFLAFVLTVSRSKKKAIFSVLCLISILLSGSRTGLAIGIFTLLLYVVFFLKVNLKNFLLTLAVIVGVLFIVIIIWVLDDSLYKEYLPYYYYTVKSLQDISLSEMGNISSLSGRIRSWKASLDYFQESPVFGNGPMRGYRGSSTDSYYFYLLSRSGILGFIWYISFTCYTVYLSIKATKLQEDKRYFNLILLTVIVIFTANFMADTGISLPVLTYLFVLIGIASNKAAVPNTVNAA